MEKFRWVPKEEAAHPKKAGCYKCTLNDGKVHDVYGTFFANGWFWQFDREVEIDFHTRGIGKPEVIAWFPNPEPYQHAN